MKNILAFFKNFVARTLGRMGLEIRYNGLGGKYTRTSMQGALSNIKELGLNPGSIIDVGAAFGEWTSTVSPIFPKAICSMIEPLEEYAPMLSRLENKTDKIKKYQFAASDEDGISKIYVHRDLVGSSLKKEFEEYNQKNAQERKVETIRIDTLIKKEGLPSPFIIKIDAQGSELCVLSGAENALKKTDAVILEVSLLETVEKADLLHEVVVFMKKRGFVVYDIFGFSYRPTDRALSQIDMLFVPENSWLLSSKVYATKEQRDKQDARFVDIYKNRIEQTK